MPDQNNPEFGAPQGPSEQQPTPNQPLNSAVDNFGRVSENAEAVAKAFADALNKIPTSVSEASKAIKTMGVELETDVEHATNVKEALTSISAAAKGLKKGVFSTKNFKDAKDALKDIYEAQNKVKKLAKEGTREYAAAVKIQKEIATYQEKYKNEIEATGDAIKEMSRGALKDLEAITYKCADGAEKLKTTLKSISINPLTRQIHSMAGTLAHIGIGKGMAAKMEKYTAGAEIKQKVKERQEARIAGNVAQAQKKKAEAMDIVKAKYPNLIGKNGELDMTSLDARKHVSRQMGLGRKAAKLFEGGAADTEAFEHGIGGAAGVASKVAGGVEGGVGAIAGVAAEVAPVLAVLEVLREMFDKQAKQNKDMEANLGKAGLFAGGGTGFDLARAALTPATAYTRLGLSYDRNLKIAGALQEGGRGLTELTTGPKGENKAGAEFGPGGFGQFQRIAVGAARVAGLTDTEGIQQTLKLLDQYNETLENSEDFFVKVRKGADAAGLSTTKYIALIDEVNGHFNRMNKSLDQTLSMLGELSKTGRVGAEDLKQYMDFLTQGGPAKGMADVPLNAYAMMNESPERKQLRTEMAKYDVGDAIKKAQDAGITLTPDQVDALNKGGPAAQKIVNQLDYALSGNKNLALDQRQNRENAIDMLERTTGHLGRIRAGGGAIAQSFGMTIGQGAAELALKNQDLLERAVAVSDGTMQEYMQKGPEQFAAEHKAFQPAYAQFGGDTGTLLAQHRGQRQAAQTMLRSFTGIGGMKGNEQVQTIKDAKLFLRELDKDTKIKLGLTDKVIDNLEPDGLEKIFQKNNDMFSKIAPGMGATADFVMRSRLMGQDVTGTDVANAIEHARMIGMRTQDTGEMIANAFSKWFNDIITFLGFIVDHIRGTSDATRAQAKAETDKPEFQKRLSATLASLDKQQGEAQLTMEDETKSTDVREQARQKFEEMRDKKDRLQQTPQDLGDVDDMKALMGDVATGALGKYTKAGAAIAAPERQPMSLTGAMQETPEEAADRVAHGIADTLADIDRKGLTGMTPAEKIQADITRQDLAGQTMGALAGLQGVDVDKNTGAVVIDKEASATLSDMIKTLVASGAIAGGAVDKSGNVTYHIYSADITHMPVAGNALSAKTKESTPTAPAVKQP